MKIHFQVSKSGILVKKSPANFLKRKIIKRSLYFRHTISKEMFTNGKKPDFKFQDWGVF